VEPSLVPVLARPVSLDGTGLVASIVILLPLPCSDAANIARIIRQQKESRTDQRAQRY
jgi:hypothetical protein